MRTLVNKFIYNKYPQIFRSDIPPFRDDEGLYLEGEKAQLCSHLFHAADRSRHVLHIQQGESR